MPLNPVKSTVADPASLRENSRDRAVGATGRSVVVQYESLKEKCVFERMARLLILLLISWVVMTFTHELGHLIGGWSCGATLQAVDMWPWRLPYIIFFQS